MKRLALTLLVAFSLALPSAVFADSGAAASAAPLPFLSFQLNPAVGFGSGSSFGSAVGGDLWLSANYRLPFFKVMFLSADLGVNYFGIESGHTSGDATLFTAGGGFGFGWRLFQKLDLSLYLKGGFAFPTTSVSDKTITDAFVPDFAYALGANVSYLFSPAFALGLDVALRGAGSYYYEVAAALGITFNLYSAGQQPTPLKETPAAKPAPLENKPPEESKPAPVVEKKPVPRTGTGVELFQVEVDNIFPIFSKYYDENAIGKGTLHNWEKAPVENIKVNLMVKGYMAEKKPCKAPSRLDPGEEQGVELFGLFTDDVLKITQGTKALANISVEYTLKGEKKTNEFVETIRFHDRNAMTWDDDRKAAAFVTAKDTSVLVFSNNINSMVKGKMNRAVEKNLQTAMALHDALRLYGISYVSNPLTPYSVVSKDKMAVDTLKFPRQTFEFKSGDCSDLSILYSALLESVQIETAFITIPGHIFMAFALKTDPNDAKSSFAQSLDDLIIRENKVWVPIEVTERDKTFLDAWQEGAKEWRENLSRDQVGFFPIHDAWKVYEPVFFPSTDISLSMPNAVNVVQDFQNDVTRFVELEIFPRKAQLQATITKTKEDPKAVNALGVLYARYDLADSAEREFQRVLSKNEYLPALVNLGNLYYLKHDWDKSLSFYERAYKISPKDPKVLLYLARANHELENYGQVKRNYDMLKTIDPDLASRFAYLDLKGEASTRAAEISGVKEEIVWYEK